MAESHPPKKKSTRPKLERKASLRRGGKSGKKSLRKQAAKQQRDKELFTGTFLPPGAGPQAPDCYGSSSWDKQAEILKKPQTNQTKSSSLFSSDSPFQKWRQTLTSLWQKKDPIETAPIQQPEKITKYKEITHQKYTQALAWTKQKLTAMWAWTCRVSTIPYDGLQKGFHASRGIIIRWFHVAYQGIVDVLHLVSKQIASFSQQASEKMAAERAKKKQSRKSGSPKKKKNP